MITGFTARNLMHKLLLPEEDSFSFSDEGTAKLVRLAVADGVTLNFEDGISVDKSFRSLIKILSGKYPKPSRAKMASNDFCQSSTNAPSILSSGEISQQDITDAFRFANESITEFNANLKLDYLPDDLAGCTASLAVVKAKDVFYGFICDSGLVVFNSNGDIHFKTKSEMVYGEEHIRNFDWRNPKFREYWRGKYRNNPENRSDKTGELASFGVLNGQPQALAYVRTGEFELKDKQILMLYTDGLTKLMGEGIFRDKIREGTEKRDFSCLERYCRKKVSSEGTAVIYVPER